MKERFVVMAIVISSIASTAMADAQYGLEQIAQELQILDRQAKEASAVATVHPSSIAPPLARWFLLRKGESLCALRFTEFRYAPTQDGKMRSVTRDSFFANYDWFYQGDGSGDISKSNVKSGHGEASRKPNWWRFERGNLFVECGSLKARWWYPNKIFFINQDFRFSYNPETLYPPNDIEIALTGWKNINDVNAQDPRLEWHRYDKQRDLSNGNDKSTIVPVEKLPGFN